MEIKFPKDKKKQRYLLLIIAVVIVVVFVIIWIGFFRGEGTISPGEAQPKEEIRINFSILEDPILEQLSPFEEISPFGDKEGRSNPFVPY